MALPRRAALEAALRRSGNPSYLTRVQRLRLFVLLGSLTAFGPLSIDMYLPALPAIARDLAASESVIQLTLTACFIGLALGQIVAGPLSDAYGRRGARPSRRAPLPACGARLRGGRSLSDWPPSRWRPCSARRRRTSGRSSRCGSSRARPARRASSSPARSC